MRKKISKEKQQETIESDQIKRMNYDLKHINKPTRYFNINEEVIIGSLGKCYILESFENGLYYKVLCNYTDNNYGNPIAKTKIDYWFWHDIFPLSINNSTSDFTNKEDVRLNYYNADISSLISKVYYQGVDFTPEYQRDYVWSLEDKQYLIHSIFNKIDIGKFTFYIRSYEEEKQIGDGNRCEIIDGKQRLSTLIEFYENRFQYNGKYYTDLGNYDRHTFKGFQIAYSEAQNLTKQQRIKLFLKVNITGKVMDKEHLENVKKLITK